MIRTTAMWIIASWTMAVGTCWSADDFKPWPRNVKPARDYYDYLSDNEFDSLIPGPIFYTFFIDEWRQRPLTNKLFSIDSSRFSRDADVMFQGRVFPNFKDVRFLGRTVNELSQANSRTAVAVLKKALALLEDTKLRSDALRTLATFRATYPQDDLKQLMGSKDHHVRAGAAALYATQSYSKSDQLLAMAATESGPRKLRLIELAATCKECGSITQWKPYLKDEAEAIKALPGVVRSKGPELEAALQTLSRHPSAPVRFALVSNYRQWPKSVTIDFLKRLSKDPLSSIRGTVAEAIGNGRHEALLSELCKLAASTPASVRAKAAVSLRQFPGDTSFATLTTLTGDPRFNVRDSAKDSMLAMVGKYDVDAGLAANMRHKNAFIRFNAYLVSAALESTRHAKLLATAVPKEKDPEILAAGMEAWVIAGGDESRAYILRQAKHKSVLVRISVVRAIGRQRWTQAYPILTKCVLKDSNEPEYRRMALIAMGWTQNNAFSKELLWTLKNAFLLRSF